MISMVRERIVGSKRPGAAVVRAIVLCETRSQKAILVGKGGEMVKAIGSAARPEIERVLGSPVHLDLSIRAQPHWRRDESALDRMGV